MADSVKIHYGTSKYSTLCYAKMINKKFGPQDVKNCLQGVWGKPNNSALRRALRELVRSGFLEQDSDSYLITPNGVDEIYASVGRYKSNRDNKLGRLRAKMSSVNEEDIF